MSDTSNPPQPPAPGTPPPPPPPAHNPLDQLNTWAQSIGTREKEQGRQQALRELQEQLGMTPDEAKAFIEQMRTKEREGMAEADRKLAEAADKEKAAQALADKAAERELSAEIRAQLIEAGLNREQAAQVRALVSVELKDWSEEKVKTAIEAVKTTFPQLFPEDAGDPNDQGGTPPPPGTPPGPPDSHVRGTQTQRPPAGGTAAAKERARARLAERHPQTVKSA